jgi:AraC-like DNA-binding protein
MTLAAQQLRDTDTPLTVIARDSGYCTASSGMDLP